MQSPRLSISSASPAALRDLLQTHDDDPDIPRASLLFVLVGIGYLFPFSALTQPVDYWNLLFPDFNIEFPLTTLYMWTNLFVLGYLVGFSSTTSFSPRMIGGFVGQLLVLVFVPSTYFGYFTEDTNKMLVLGATAAAAIATAFLDSSVIALSSLYPLRVQEALQLGVGVSTLIGSLYRDVTKLIVPNVVVSSLLYFYAGAATIAICIVAYLDLMRLDISKTCLTRAKTTQTPIDTLDLAEESTHLLKEKEKANTVDRWQVLRKIWFNELMVATLFASTLTLWPPLVTEIPGYNRLGDWWSLVLLTVFSTGDCLGRILVRFRGPWNHRNIWIPVCLRLVLVPLIICSVRGWIFTNDAFSVLFVSALGFTNGYVGTLTIVFVNDCCSSKAEQSVAGTFTSFSLNTGLVVGATVGLCLDRVIVQPMR